LARAKAQHLAVRTAAQQDGGVEVPMRVAIIENTSVTHHGQVGVALHEAAARITQFRPWADGGLPEQQDFDALISFGGEQSAISDQSHPYLPDLARRMRAFSEAGKAVLGICLGAQVLARGFGAQNFLGTAPEFGWRQVTLTGAAAGDPVLSALPQDFPIFEWHADTFTLPEGAVHLAQSPVTAQQAFRIGRATYGMQFHFEASRAMVADWARMFPDLIEAASPGWHSSHKDQAASLGVAADAHGLAMARGFVALI
jgi:GMP synthase (glutamine-hydrolysing)